MTGKVCLKKTDMHGNFSNFLHILSVILCLALPTVYVKIFAYAVNLCAIHKQDNFELLFSTQSVKLSGYENGS